MSMIAGRRRDSVSGASSPMPGGATTSVQVAVRIRPLTSADQSSIPSRWQRSVVHASSSNSLHVEQGAAPPPGTAGAAAPASALSSSSRDKKQAFSFDRVLSPNDGQPQVYTVAEPLISRFLEGYNVTILAYGQTSSGKSYTMGTSAGDEIDYESLVAGQTADPQMGIIPRAVAQIFSTIKQNQARSGAVQYSAKASFIEIYNEDLIDLLADADGDARPHVQIREGKNGAIIWSGLREVKVSNVAEVMNYLLQGSSVRRTNETDMNAQSSRSHAIFSLTLTQRKYVGSGPPPPAAGSRARQSSGLPRPGSSIVPPGSFDRSRVASPAPGTLGSRPHTPSSSGIPGLGGRHSSVGLRPASTIAGARSASPMFGGGADDAAGKAGAEGEWTTVTSKFHFVDLAGSERLKRTAAQGERAKEGISINSGLHALGNVISALGDPNKAKRTTHVPYRDSKLTRLLQDSLGGNAHTLMIACVSPAEYNVSETVNTLQYANRARNIKNKAELNEVEVGWDDIDYLQTLVLKLRKELSILKGTAGKGGADASSAAGGDDGGSGSARAAQREILEWQDKYASLSQKHSQLTAEVTKLRAQLDPAKHRGTDQDDYFKLAEPIIVEYEKSIDALEGQLNLTKAALAYVEDMVNEQQAIMEDQSAKLQTVESEMEAKEMTVVELQSKLAKLQLRETSADAYAKELEARLEGITTRGDTDAALVADLRKEAAKLRDSARTTESYVKDLEAKLASADEATAKLSARVSQLVSESEQREADYKNLAARFELLDSGDERKAMSTELDAREERLADLRRQLDVVTGERDVAAKQHSILLTASAAHEREKDELMGKIHALEAAAAAAAAAGAAAGAGVARAAGSPEEAGSGGEEAAQFRQQLEQVQQELQALRDSESQLRTDYELRNVKYRDALREVEALNTQLTEAKLEGRLPRADSSFRLDVGDAGGDEELEVLAPPSDEGRSDNSSRSPMRQTASRRSSLRRPESLLVDNSNRQSPINNRLMRRSSGSFLGYNKSDGTRTPGSSPHVRTRSMSQSLSQELLAGLSPSPSQQPIRGPRPLSLTGSVPPSPTLRAFEPDSAANYERKVASLEKEAMRLQEALKERDDEIHTLEATVRELRSSSSGFNTAAASNSSSVSGEDAESLPTTDAAGSFSAAGAAPIAPASEKDFDAFRRLLAEARVTDETGEEPNRESILRLDDLMRAMARKETTHRESVEARDRELSSLRKEKETLEALSKDQLANMSNEIEALRAQLNDARADKENAGRPSAEVAALQPSQARNLAPLDVQEQESKRRSLIAEQHASFQKELASVKEAHAATLSSKEAEHSSEREELVRQHEAAMTRKVKELQDAANRRAEEHEQALTHLRDEHERRREALVEERAAALSNAEIARQSSTVESESERESLLRKLQEDHQSMIAKLKEDHELTLSKSLEAKQVEHQSIVADHVAKLQALQEESDAALERLKLDHERALQKLTAEHAATLTSAKETSDRSVDNLRMELEAQHMTMLTEALREAENRAKGEHDSALAALRAEHEAKTEVLAKAHAAALDEAELRYTKAVTGHASAVDDLSREHAGSSTEAAETIAKLRAEHEELQRSLEKLRQEAVAAEEHQRDELERVVQELQYILADRDATKKAYGELEAKHRDYVDKSDFDPHEVDQLRSDLAETSDALITLEAALTEAQEERDQLLIEIETARQSAAEGSLANGLVNGLASANGNGHADGANGDRSVTVTNGAGPVDPALSRELEAHKSALSKTKAEMDKIRADLQGMVEERGRQEQTIKELQAKLASSETRSVRSQGSGSFGHNSNGEVENAANASASVSGAMANGSRLSMGRRASDYDGLGFEHRPSRNSSAPKPPPPNPPPKMPPPPTPTGSSVASPGLVRSPVGVRTSTSSQMTRPDSPSGITRSSSIASAHSASLNGVGNGGGGGAGPGALAVDAKYAKLVAEQADEIKNLAKQLNHCEADLQANIDLVATLEAALNDSERNLRKSRVQLAEVTRERDRYSAQADEMRAQLNTAQHEVESVRNSVMLEKQGYESKLEEERQAKERARQALEARLEEVSKRKNSKLFCL
ncbi:uncharacterized protein PFL1_05489 [Pseudozyma flocculosa PF-1]|uniref:Related to KIP1 - kinesin-related protein n=2 Tax=Pseudozyma flocculosa TaxID=84751 RepID=A0A5C3FCP4_9BASI|nr:uncharacterized protein PFL1_05489 [Pseudozyma flocculosa PF-1]EPQ26854.1 hypothetical protein PFL1_05489 [Pseudozyma flocculosa PF-1]SPO41241.1 related to KIP1 - kinesin-related protein [Pseudozyma flocculosa]